MCSGEWEENNPSSQLDASKGPDFECLREGPPIQAPSAPSARPFKQLVHTA